MAQQDWTPTYVMTHTSNLLSNLPSFTSEILYPDSGLHCLHWRWRVDWLSDRFLESCYAKETLSIHPSVVIMLGLLAVKLLEGPTHLKQDRDHSMKYIPQEFRL